MNRFRSALTSSPAKPTACARRLPRSTPLVQDADPQASAAQAWPADRVQAHRIGDEQRAGRQTSQPAPRSPRRTAPGATKASVLTALADGEAMTAGQVADKTGLARPTVSTTLSKLAKSGEVQKAERGYRIAPTAAPSEAASPAPAE